MILLTADYHIKLGQKNVPKEWALNRYDLFFKELSAAEHGCKLHVIAGDIFDRVPTMEELQVYFKLVSTRSIRTILIDGNHEATKKNSTFMTYLKESTNRINSLVRIIDSTEHIEDFAFLPYCDLHKKGIFDTIKPVPLFTHVRGEIPPHVKPEVPLENFDKFPIVFAGDLHSHSNCQRNIVYPGSPMTTSFHRSIVKTGYILIDKNWGWTWHEFKLPQLIRKTVSDPTEMVPTDYHHTIYELEGNLQDLSDVKNSELLDKKIIKRNNETALILNKDMSISDELTEYLTYILEIQDISGIMHTFNEYKK